MSKIVAKFIGIGVGPGDPELITLKAAKLIRQADVISYIANEQGGSQSRSIAAQLISECEREIAELPIVMPMCDNRDQANHVYDQAASHIARMIEQDKTVVFLCEGDPLFFGSFAYLLERLQAVDIICDVVPGISSVHAASSVLKMPLTLLKESFAVVSGRHSSEKLIETLNAYDSVVIMKAGRSRQKIIRALKATGRADDAQYLEYIGRDDEVICHDVHQLADQEGPYFSLFVVLPAKRSQ